ncbi:MAG: transcriptional regulator, partial [Planctomycetes bacterium]|nr:transcriptional regulator [Planctomycetota bacterium]
YLSKLLRVLTRAQLLVGKPGAKGGYRLKASAARIRLVDAIVAFDPQVTQPICVLRGTRLCGRSSPCPVHDRWKLVRGSLNRFLETTTAADLARHGWRGWSAR